MLILNNADIYIGSIQISEIYEGNTKLYPKSTYPKNNEVWYTTTDGEKINPGRGENYGDNLGIWQNTYVGEGIIRLSSTGYPYIDNVTRIGGLDGRTTLKTISLPNTCETVSGGAFSNCTSLTNIDFNSVLKIEREIINGCTSLDSITIPSTVNEIDSNALEGNYLSRITVNSSNPYYDSRNNCNAIIDTSSNILIGGCKNTTIPSGVTAIGYSAFRECTLLSAITIPDSVTNISGWAFDSCTSLASVTIGNSVDEIGNCAFSDCTSLTSVTIPSSVTYIRSFAFYSSSGLTSITCEATTPPWLEMDVFKNTNNCPIYVPFTSVETYKTASSWSDYSSRIQAIPT